VADAVALARELALDEATAATLIDPEEYLTLFPETLARWYQQEADELRAIIAFGEEAPDNDWKVDLAAKRDRDRFVFLAEAYAHERYAAGLFESQAMDVLGGVFPDVPFTGLVTTAEWGFTEWLTAIGSAAAGVAIGIAAVAAAVVSLGGSVPATVLIVGSGFGAAVAGLSAAAAVVERSEAGVLTTQDVLVDTLQVAGSLAGIGSMVLGKVAVSSAVKTTGFARLAALSQRAFPAGHPRRRGRRPRQLRDPSPPGYPSRCGRSTPCRDPLRTATSPARGCSGSCSRRAC
jgi:hypothetical protein